VSQLTSVHISGFKSLRDVDLTLGSVNVLIGANGAGKSNVTSFFKMLNFMMTGALGEFIGRSGGAGDILHFGAKTTPVLTAELQIASDTGNNTYAFKLGHASPDRFIFLAESYSYSQTGRDPGRAPATDLGSGHNECRLREVGDNPTGSFIRRAISGIRFFQFHDTSPTAYVKQMQNLEDNRYLKSDAGNLAPFLYMLHQKYPAAYDRILRTLRKVIPFLEDFQLAPSMLNEKKIQLEWREKGSPAVFGPHMLSDGSLRFIALTTLLLQPKELLPSLIIIDEPELGLHPSAIRLLASMVRSASAHAQLVLATQSKELVDAFQLEDILVVDREAADGRESSVLRRLPRPEFAVWLEKYSLGEMWEHNLIRGRPA